MNDTTKHINWLEFVYENKNKFGTIDDFYKAYDEYSFDFYTRQKQTGESEFFNLYYNEFPLTYSFLKCRSRIDPFKLIVKSLSDLINLHEKFETSLQGYTMLIASYTYTGSRTSNVFENMFKHKMDFTNFDQVVYRLIHDSIVVKNSTSEFSFRHKFKTLLKNKYILSTDTIELISNVDLDDFMSQLFATILVPDRIVKHRINEFNLDIDFDYSQHFGISKFQHLINGDFETEFLNILQGKHYKFTTLVQHDIFFEFAVTRFNVLQNEWIQYLNDCDYKMLNNHLDAHRIVFEKLMDLLTNVGDNYLKLLLTSKINPEVIRALINNVELSSELALKMSKHIMIFEI